MFTLRLLVLLWVSFSLFSCTKRAQQSEGPKAPSLPNILWITSEDTSPVFGCYGDPMATTPHIDQLAYRSLQLKPCVIWVNVKVLYRFWKSGYRMTGHGWHYRQHAA